MEGEDGIPWCCVGCVCIHRNIFWFSCCVWTNPRSFVFYPLILTLVGWHCVFGWWYLHIGRCCHCWLHLNALGFVCYIVSRGGCNGGSSSRGRTLSRLVPYTCFSLLLLRSLGVYINKLIIFFILVLIMAWATKGSKGPLLLVLHAFYRHRVLVAL
jgi:hypothetical protein